MGVNVGGSFLCCVLNEVTEDHWAFLLDGDSTVQQLYDQVAARCGRSQYSFKLRVKKVDGPTGTVDSINLHNSKAKKLKDVGFQTGADVRNNITLAMKDAKETKEAGGEELGACGDSLLSPPPDPPPPPPVTTPASSNWPSLVHEESSSMPVPFVGLVNQAMTCYLNSLLQALFMTPEFRNAMYRWEYDGAQGSELPLELQKLFLKLQTSKKNSVETTALTKSFGWNSSEAWQQHDIQELCRLLFDALERQFKGTDQGDLISRLYEGTMLDYVKCLECCTERHREDKFLDIPLPVRPFGSTAAYNSVEEALRAFVQPETLDGSNQYHCEKCNKKCDAHKGLKFTHFPYLLTLHLKRFAFDFNTLNRIKLNDKVTFPYTLNLNGFLKKTNGVGNGEAGEEVVKCDDCSTTDSGSAFDEDNVESPGAATSNHVDLQEEDEGIDMSNTAESEKNRANASEPGPFMYDLFSIMIHSGSASGGHYYAYIKDYTSGEWFCFNDHSVQRINKDDIERTYGGGNRYSASCYSSTNAYMLMYRQIDLTRNVNAMTEEEFPPHLHKQLKVIEELKEIQQRIQQGEKDLKRIKCYFKSPEEDKIKCFRLCVNKNSSLRCVLLEALQGFNLDSSVPIEQCRLVTYDSTKHKIESSLEGRDDEKIGEIMLDSYREDLLLQIRGPSEVFPVHRIGDITTSVMVINPMKYDLERPVVIATNENMLVDKYRNEVANALGFDPATTQLFTYSYHGEVLPVLSFDKKLSEMRIINKDRIYVYNGPPTESHNIEGIIQWAQNIISLHINLPLVDEKILQELNIPSASLDDYQEPDADYQYSAGLVEHSDQSASEDSSVTDSDRTIVPNVPSSPDNMSPRGSPVSGRCASPADQSFLNQLTSGSSVNPKICSIYSDDQLNYFKVLPRSELPKTSNLEVLVDKRILASQLKKLIERYVGVHRDYFKMFLSANEQELRYDLSMTTAKDNSVITIRLGRAPRKGEHSGKVYLLDLSQDEPEKYLFDWLIATGASVNDVKKELLDEAQRRYNMDIPRNRCRLRQKKYKIPEQPYMDDALINDISSNWAMFIQELNEEEPLRNPTEQKLVFVRQWCPSTREVKPFSEYLLEGGTVTELVQKISEKCDVPVENIELAYGQDNFPCKVTQRDVHSDLEWKLASLYNIHDMLNVFPINQSDKHVVFFRDSREILKVPSHDELVNKSTERRHYRRHRDPKPCSSREKALRICPDVPKSEADAE